MSTDSCDRQSTNLKNMVTDAQLSVDQHIGHIGRYADMLTDTQLVVPTDTRLIGP